MMAGLFWKTPMAFSISCFFMNCLAPLVFILYLKAASEGAWLVI